MLKPINLIEIYVGCKLKRLETNLYFYDYTLPSPFTNKAKKKKN